ncbi:hypothetical protein HDV01_000606 [Terramyces sp. JEL0728]|nr:hypothetical protein HDV01_000606 [Terramyces sp. JEL0728]
MFRTAILRNHNFDTYKFVQRLEADGFSREGAEAIMNSLTEVVYDSCANLENSSVTRPDFDKALYVARVDLAQLRSEISMLEKNEFSLLKQDIRRLNSEAMKLPSRITEEIKRVQSNVRLELSLDKAKIRDEQNTQEMKIKEAASRIDTEVSQFKTQMETIQWELFRTLFPIFTAGGALFFSYLRFIK